MLTLPVVRSSPTTCAAPCQHCGEQITIQTAQLQDRFTMPITCRCGHVIRLVRNRRRFQRKAVQLSGALFDITTQAPLAQVTLVDLSLGGVGFLSHQYAVKVGDRFQLMFRLDGTCQTVIEKEIIVRNVKDSQHVGAEFRYEDAYNFELELYLTPWAVLLEAHSPSEDMDPIQKPILP